MSFGDHLEELRGCLIRSLAGVAVATAVTFYFGKDILELIYRPLLKVQYANGLAPKIQVLAPTSAFTAFLKIGFLSGLILAAPWVMVQIWSFIASGLYPRERRFVSRLAPASTVLFLIGVLFLYFIVLPIMLNFFINFNKGFGLPDLKPTGFERLLLPGEGPEQDAAAAVPDAEPVSSFPRIAVVPTDPEKPAPGTMWYNDQARQLKIQGESDVWTIPMERGDRPVTMHSQFAIDFYISFVLMLALAFGIAFETPIVVFFLAWSGIVSRAVMVRGRRYVVLVTVILAAVLTPPDVISQLLLAIPMYLLFELGLLIARTVERRGDAPSASA